MLLSLLAYYMISMCVTGAGNTLAGMLVVISAMSEIAAR